MSNAEFSFLLKKYLEGKATPAEVALVEEFYEEFQKKENINWTDWSTEEKELIEQRIRSKITAKINPKKKINRFQPWTRVAAAILLLVSITVLIFTVQSPKPITDQATSLTIETKSKDTTILLEDGSYVYLYPNSTLTYPKVFDQNSRSVQLIGQAWFEIQRDTTKPFSVESQDITTIVLGTSFVVRAFADEEEIKVKVTSGRVRVKNNTEEWGVLTQNETLAYNTMAQSFTKLEEEIVSASTDNSNEREIKFNNVTMKDAIDFLNRRWKQSIEIVNPKIANCRLVASFLPHDDLDEILTILCGISNTHYERQEQKIKIYGSGCER